MEIKGINILEEAFNRSNGKDATISISHKLYGNQKIVGTLDCFCDNHRIGFRVKNGQEIFIYNNEITTYGIEDGVYFADKIMEIRIKLHGQ